MMIDKDKFDRFLTIKGHQFLCPCIESHCKDKYPNGYMKDVSWLITLDDELVKDYFMAARYPDHYDEDGKRYCRIQRPRAITKKEYFESQKIVIHPASDKPSLPGLYICLSGRSVVSLLFFNGEEWEYPQENSDKFYYSDNFHWIHKDHIK